MKIAGHFYLYRVESYRDGDGRVRQRVLEYLGALNPIYKHHTVSFVHRVDPRTIRDEAPPVGAGLLEAGDGSAAVREPPSATGAARART